MDFPKLRSTQIHHPAMSANLSHYANVIIKIFRDFQITPSWNFNFRSSVIKWRVQIWMIVVHGFCDNNCGSFAICKRELCVKNSRRVCRCSEIALSILFIVAIIYWFQIVLILIPVIWSDVYYATIATECKLFCSNYNKIETRQRTQWYSIQYLYKSKSDFNFGTFNSA